MTFHAGARRPPNELARRPPRRSGPSGAFSSLDLPAGFTPGRSFRVKTGQTMTLLVDPQEKRTRAGYPGEMSVAITHRGQAHFADPSIGARCSQCASYKQRPRERLPRCEKFAELSGKLGNQFPPTAVACKYFSKA